MWRRLVVPRAAAVAHRARRGDAATLSTRLLRPVQRSQQALLTTRVFSSDSSAHESSNGVALRGIALRELASRPWDELKERFGFTELKKARQTLPMHWVKLSSDAEVAPDLVEDFFAASRLCKLTKLQWEVFNYMETHYSHRVSYEMYGQMFDFLVKNKEPERMRAVFERAMTRYDPEQGVVAPEIVYRLGISAAIALNDYVGMQTLMHEMTANGVEISIEIVTRALVAQAKHGDVKTVLATVKKLDPQDDKKWHEADVNRVIESLGIAGEPDAAFDFYRRSQSRLSAKTLMALVNVCRANARPKHALAILANRRRFGLKMMPSQYSKLLEIIEELGIGGAPANEMALLLKEMRENSIAFDSHIHAVIGRNQKHLHGTPFKVTPPISQDSDEKSEVETIYQFREKDIDIPLIRELLDTRQFAQAAAIVDTYTTPDSEDRFLGKVRRDEDLLDNEATIIPEWLADMAVEAYSQNKEVDKLQSLMQGFLSVRGEFRQESTVRYALSRTVGLFGGKGRSRNNRIAYDAFLAMQFHGFAIFRVQDALARFEQYQDTDAVLELLRQVTAEIGEALRDVGGAKNGHDARGRPMDFMYILNKSDKLHFDPGRTIRDVLRILVASKELGKALGALSHLESQRVPIRVVDYENIFSAMNKANNSGDKMFTVEDFMLIWDDMTRRGVAPNKAVIRLTIPTLCDNTEVYDIDRRRRIQHVVLEGYHQAAKDRHDSYVLPVSCFSALLTAAAESGSIADMHTIYSGAVKSLGSSMNQKNLSPADHSELMETWATVRLEKVAAEGNALDSVALLRKTPSPSRKAVMAVLCSGFQDVKHGREVIDETLSMFRQSGYELEFSDAVRLMQAAKSANSAAFGLQVVQLYDEIGERKGIAARIEQVYRDCLALCEQAGDSDNASLLRHRLETLRCENTTMEDKQEQGYCENRN